jgi:hypothetical protein
MAPSRSNRFILADLVVVVVMCGLVVALVRVPVGSEQLAVLIVAFLVLTTWATWRAMRLGAPCQECGRRFIPTSRPGLPRECPHCSRRQVALLRSSKRLRYLFWALVLLIPLGLTVALACGPGPSSPAPEGIRLVVWLGATVGMLLSFLSAVIVGAYRYIRERPRDRNCEACGGVIPGFPAASLTCPVCRLRKLGPDDAQKAQTKGVWISLFSWAPLVVVFLAILVPMLADWSPAGTRGIRDAVFILIGIGGMVLAMFAGRFAIRVRVFNRFLSQPAALARARHCAGEPGRIVEDGPSAIWYSGPTDPAPMLRKQGESARSRFASLVGETATDPSPLRVFCFHDRGAFEAFHARIGLGKGITRQDGLYIQRPWGIATLCIGESPRRVTDPEATARSLFGFALMEEAFGSLPAPWLQLGISKALARSAHAFEPIHLNRKMLAAIGRGATWSEDLFHPSPMPYIKLLRRPDDPGSYQKSDQFAEQSASIVEYLCGDRAPGERKAAFRDFLMDKTSVGRQEESFFQRFGFGFGSLLDSWREWVLDQGIGPHEPPPGPTRDALLHRLLPVIADGLARRSDRIMALREWARLGFVLGADILIGQLREGGDIPKEEIAWALSMASGMALGNETDRWQAWWEGLPIAVREPQPDGVETQLPARLSEV